MDVNIDIGLKLMNISIVLLSAALNIYLFFKTKQDKRFTDIEDVMEDSDRRIIGETAQRHEDVGKLVLRVTVLESRVNSMPTHDDISEIHKRISDLANSMSAVNERSSSTNSAVNRIERYLLENKS